MLRTLRDLEHYKIEATDGDIGRVCDFCFDDLHWTIRYLVVDTAGYWDGPHRVLISPISFRQADWSTKRFHVALTKQKIKHSPSVEVDRPVSRQYENDYFRYYQWAPYWGYAGNWNWGAGGLPNSLAPSRWSEELARKSDVVGDAHLRSVQEVTGYQVKSGDHVVGFVTDFIVDDETWELRYLVIETHKWWFGKKVLVSPRWAKEISWVDRTIYTDLPRDKIKESPEWVPDAAVNRVYEARLYDFYGQPAYWLDTDRAREEAVITRLPSEPPRAR